MEVDGRIVREDEFDQTEGILRAAALPHEKSARGDLVEIVDGVGKDRRRAVGGNDLIGVAAHVGVGALGSRERRRNEFALGNGRGDVPSRAEIDVLHLAVEDGGFADPLHPDDSGHHRNLALVAVNAQGVFGDVHLNVFPIFPTPGHPAEPVDVDDDLVHPHGGGGIELLQGGGSDESVGLNAVAELERFEGVSGAIIDRSFTALGGAAGQVTFGLEAGGEEIQFGILGAGPCRLCRAGEVLPAAHGGDLAVTGEGLHHLRVSGVLGRDDLEKIGGELRARPLQGLIEKLVGGYLAGDGRPFGVDRGGIDKAIGERLDRVEGQLGGPDLDGGTLGRIGARIAPLGIPCAELKELGRKAMSVEGLEELGKASDVFPGPDGLIAAGGIPAGDPFTRLGGLGADRPAHVLTGSVQA